MSNDPQFTAHVLYAACLPEASALVTDWSLARELAEKLGGDLAGVRVTEAGARVSTIRVGEQTVEVGVCPQGTTAVVSVLSRLDVADNIVRAEGGVAPLDIPMAALRLTADVLSLREEMEVAA